MRFGGGREEGHTGACRDDGVEVHALPGEEGEVGAEDDEGGYDEGECGLCCEPRGDVVVFLSRERLLSSWVEEEGSYVAAEI